MARTFTHSDLVTLPIMDTATTIAVVTEVILVATALGMLPTGTEKAFAQLRKRQKALRDAASRTRPLPVVDPERARVADRAIDAAYAALLAFLEAYAALPGDLPEKERAERVRLALFPDRLRFTMLPNRAEWAESDARLRQIARDGLDAEITALGGRVFLDAIRAAHEEYGTALGITELAPEAPNQPPVRELLLATLDALRTYVVRVSASIEPGDAASTATAERLLRPITAVAGRRPKASAPAQPEPAAPAPEPATTNDPSPAS